MKPRPYHNNNLRLDRSGHWRYRRTWKPDPGLAMLLLVVVLFAILFALSFPLR